MEMGNAPALKEMGTTLIRDFIHWLSTKKGVTDAIARRGMRYGFAQRFIAGETLDDAIRASAELCAASRRVILNHLGENVASAQEAHAARDTYVQALRALDDAGLDADISIKLTQLGLDVDRNLCLSLTEEIASAAASLHRSVEIDMEGSSYTQATIEIFEAARLRQANIGVAIQSYLRRSERDIERLAPLGPKIRLVKGAYREAAAIAFQQKREVDDNYRRLLERLLRPNANAAYGVVHFTAAIGTHDPVLIGYAQEKIREYGLPAGRYEFQMIYGIRRDLQQQVIAAGHPLRVYVPFGTAWCPYFMRRLAERPANVWFVLRSLFAERKSPR